MSLMDSLFIVPILHVLSSLEPGYQSSIVSISFPCSFTNPSCKHEVLPERYAIIKHCVFNFSRHTYDIKSSQKSVSLRSIFSFRLHALSLQFEAMRLRVRRGAALYIMQPYLPLRTQQTASCDGGAGVSGGLRARSKAARQR